MKVPGIVLDTIESTVKPNIRINREKTQGLNYISVAYTLYNGLVIIFRWKNPEVKRLKYPLNKYV
jgi:hypothetical protein